MNPKWHGFFSQVASLAAGLSPCPRAAVGCVLVDPRHKTVLSTGYNGGPRGGDALCGGDCCERTRMGLESGCMIEVGCIHAERNAISNAARMGIATDGSWAYVTTAPCLGCAKDMHQAGIVRVFLLFGHFRSEEGVSFLQSQGVQVERL